MMRPEDGAASPEEYPHHARSWLSLLPVDLDLLKITTDKAAHLK